MITHPFAGAKQRHSRRAPLLVATALAGFACSQPALAQSTDTASAPAQDTAAPQEDIIVTGSLVQRSGFTTPTPVTVIGMEAIERVSAPNIADVINQMPALRPSLTPTSATNAGGNTQTAGNFLDLRGLGYARTLVLLDGRRYVPTNPTGAVSINTIPQSVIDRVDIVTGGASAAYGADAVAGVVNLRVNSKLEGLKSTYQLGAAEEGDYRQILVSVAAGTKIGERLHLVVAGEFSDNNGITRLFDRKWSAKGPGLLANPNAGNGGLGTPEQPRFFVVDGGIRSSNATYAGVITGASFTPGNGSAISSIVNLPSYLKGIQFSDTGQAIPYTFGTLVSSGSMLGGDGLNGVAEQVGATPITRYSGFGRLTYEVGNGWEAFAEFSYHKLNSEQDGIPTAFQNSVKSDYVYLPTALRDLMIANNVASITIGKIGNDTTRVRNVFDIDTMQVSAGIKGEFAPGWNFDAYYGYGRNYSKTRAYNTRITANFANAIDAIDDPRTPGVVDAICRSTLTNPNNGCIPLNILGIVNPGDPALNYVRGMSENTNDIRQNTVAATVRGAPFSTWAGPVAVAVGGSYRDLDLVTGANAAAQSTMFGGATLPYSGEVHVKEAFGEVLVPLLENSAIGKRLEIDVAARLTDYSTSGQVTTWKGGVDYTLTDSIRLRATRSRDIRAPGLAELFQRSGSSNLSVTDFDPRYLGQSYLVTSRTAGNPNLNPEKADTFTGGIVLTPTFIPRLSLSLDYYDINIKNAIIQITPAAIVQQCFTVNTAACNFITRDEFGKITEVFSGPVNLASAMTRGVDFEMAYSVPLGPDRITFNGLVNYLIRTELSDGINITRLDDSMAQPTVAALGGNPRWKANVSTSYIADGFRLSATGRYVGGGFIDRAYTAKDVDQLRVQGRVYFDLSGEVTIFRPKGEGSKAALFAAVQNLLDNDPPITGAGGYGTTRGLYDTIGRQFIGGLRFNF
ncbi:TonB-dependent receptor plug domain-containing protein [Sphingomonas sp.]|uniref:TonB-dependent receptor plug domain-containing protein n=1 Tax=Sphingomonas sp. TaxID=28214 RepID=UPI002BC30A89|nr:TonB-dependent receptor [Sphingomonas sp.]HWK37272.1 TonB-dependent receptor [Sphingomonas sp.]